MSEEMPHLFTDERIGNHFIRTDGERVVGVVGLYPHGHRIGGVTFEAAGVGQVATHPEARGGGVMSSVLREVCREADRLDFSWLFGDRQRYGRYGWAMGGVRHVFETYDKYLPAPPAKGVAPMNLSEAMRRLQTSLARSPEAMIFSDADVKTLFGGVRAARWRAWAAGGSFVLMDGDTVLYGDGDVEELAGLLAGLAAEVRKQPGDRWKFSVMTGPHPTPLMRACQKHYWKLTTHPGANFRVGDLRSFLTKACRVAQPAITSGDGKLALQNTDTGQAVTMLCQAGQLSVRDGADGEVRRFSTVDLSELCFGPLPLNLLLPDLPTDSPFRRVLPLPVGICHVFSL